MALRGVYGKPWSKMAGDIPMTKELLNRLGEALVESVVKEAKIDLAKQGIPSRGKPAGIPNKDESFFDSFSYQIVGKSTIEILSSWPWIEQLTEGRKPFKMWWLTHGQRMGRAVPLVQRDGTVLFRMAPLSLENAWIHPGFAKHTFVQRGVRKGREAMAQVMKEEIWAMLQSGDPTK
jgi:hypothetical protein